MKDQLRPPPLNQSDDVISDRLIKLRELIPLTAKSKAAIYLGIKEGTFPRPCVIGKRAVAWKLSSIESWMANLEQTEAV